MGLNYLFAAWYSYVLALLVEGCGYSMPVVSDGQDGGQENNVRQTTINPYVIWSQRAELNRRPTDYEALAPITNHCFY